ncbi:MAG: amidohydrolase [Rikenellaceae bacterium]|nr:amidohydrolase [Rikenellaceae bacterium]
MALLFRNALVLPMTDPEEGQPMMANVGIESDRIVMIDAAEERDAECSRTADFVARNRESLVEIDATGKVLMPGLINLHTHVAMTLMRSYADDIPLMIWLGEHIWPFEAKLTVDDIALGAQLGMAEMLEGGTTTFADMYWEQATVARVARRMGIRAVVSPCFVDPRMGGFEKDVTESLAEVCDTVSVRIAPHAPYSCSEENLRRGVEVCRELGLPVHTHLAETDDEIRIVRDKYGVSPIELFDRLGYFDFPTIAAHCVKVTDRDMAILRDKQVTVVHNPQSNMKLSSGIAPVWTMMRSGVNVALGTDGASSNNDLDMWDEMRSAALLQKVSSTDPTVLPAYSALRMATADGARALGREGELGIVAEGALADVILVDLSRPHMQPIHDVVSTLVYCGKSSDVEMVVVGGRVIVRGGRVEGLDYQGLYSSVAKRLEELTRR